MQPNSILLAASWALALAVVGVSTWQLSGASDLVSDHGEASDGSFVLSGTTLGASGTGEFSLPLAGQGSGRSLSEAQDRQVALAQASEIGYPNTSRSSDVPVDAERLRIGPYDYGLKPNHINTGADAEARRYEPRDFGLRPEHLGSVKNSYREASGPIDFGLQPNRLGVAVDPNAVRLHAVDFHLEDNHIGEKLDPYHERVP